MEVEINLPKRTKRKLLNLIEDEYPDIYQDGDDEHDDKRYFVGRSSDDPLTCDSGKPTEWMTRDEAISCCGFIEGAVPEASTLLEGNGAWAQGMLSRKDFSGLAVDEEAKKCYRRDSNRFWRAFHLGQRLANSLNKK